MSHNHTMTEPQEMVHAALAHLSAEQKRELLHGTLEHFGIGGIWPGDDIDATLERRGMNITGDRRIVFNVVKFLANV